MGDKTNMELLADIVKETDLTIKCNKETGTIYFAYDIFGENEIKQFIRKQDMKEHEYNLDGLLQYVLEEIYSTIEGAKEQN